MRVVGFLSYFVCLVTFENLFFFLVIHVQDRNDASIEMTQMVWIGYFLFGPNSKEWEILWWSEDMIEAIFFLIWKNWCSRNVHNWKYFSPVKPRTSTSPTLNVFGKSFISFSVGNVVCCYTCVWCIRSRNKEL